MGPRKRLTKKAPTKSEQLFEYNNLIEDFDYQTQQAMTELHIMPDEFESADYYRMCEVLAAQPRDKRVVDPAAWLESLGL